MKGLRGLQRLDSRDIGFENVVCETVAVKKNKKTCCSSLVSIISKSFDLIRSILIRVVFGIHALIAICMVCYVKNELWYLVNSVGVIFLMIEWFVIAFRHSGKDLPWFSPSFFIYITTLIPPTWFLELENINIKMQAMMLENRKNQTVYASNTGGSSIGRQQWMSRITVSNSTTQRPIDDSISHQQLDGDDGIENIVPDEIRVALTATVDQYAIYIEVSMMLIIILGRWIMPKQGITRSELSQLLLVYMSLASDVIDLLSVLQEQAIMINMNMVYAALSIYSWSLYQFTLNLVVTRGRMYNSEDSLNVQSSRTRYNNSKSMHNELWNVLITLIMQDCPFFILRIICVVKFNVFNYSFLFFTFKNGILFALQIYRIVAILTDKDYNFDPLSDKNSSNSGNSVSVSNLAVQRVATKWARKAMLKSYRRKTMIKKDSRGGGGEQELLNPPDATTTTTTAAAAPPNQLQQQAIP